MLEYVICKMSAIVFGPQYVKCSTLVYNVATRSLFYLDLTCVFVSNCWRIYASIIWVIIDGKSYYMAMIPLTSISWHLLCVMALIWAVGIASPTNVGSWWRHEMETFSALLVLCAGNSPVTNSPHKGQWRGALMFSFICAGTNGSGNNRDDNDLRRHHAHYDVIVMSTNFCRCCQWHGWAAGRRGRCSEGRLGQADSMMTSWHGHVCSIAGPWWRDIDAKFWFCFYC